MVSTLAVTNFFPSPAHPVSGTFIERQVAGLRQVGVDVDVMIVDREGAGMKVYGGLGKRVRAKVSGSSYDLVHVMYGGVMAEIVTRATDIPTVVSFCGSDLLGEHSSGRLRAAAAGYGVWASRQAARRASGVVVKSANLRDALPAGVPARRVKIIPNGIDLERFRPLPRPECQERLEWQADTFHILFCDRDAPVKRFDLAVAACEALRARGVDTELHVLRRVPHEEVPLWLNAADVLLLTSVHEGSPNIVKEALACDRPVVSTDVGDVRARIEGIDGCWIAEADPSDLANNLEAVHRGPRVVSGRASVYDLSLEAVAARLQQFYLEILNGG